MEPWKILVMVLTVYVFVSARALDNFGEYDDGASIDPPSTDYQTDEYSDIAARLNCSKLVVLHKGVKTEENATGSIYNQPMAFTTLPPFTEITEYTTMNPEEPTEKPKSISKRSPRRHRHRKPVHDDTTISTSTEAETATSDNHTNTDDEDSLDDCVHAFNDDGSDYNWYQIIVDNGGAPGKVNATLLQPKTTKVLEPCLRPISNSSHPEDLLYDYELSEFEKVYRHERAYRRFQGSSSEFLDIVGQLVWAPPQESLRYYRLSYRKDDTGFYVDIHEREKCVFEKNPAGVNCKLVNDFSPCVTVVDESLPAGLQASLIG